MIQINNLSKIYGTTAALEGISFKVERGEIVGFLGPNGAGKSTTLNILTGYLSASSGSASVGGIDIYEFPDQAKRLIGYLPEQPPLYQEMRVSEYLNFVYELKKCRLNRKKHLEEIMQVTKIRDVSDRIIANLSKGYKQRVGIAQALVGNPPVIILDEPTVGLDPKQIIEIRNLVRNLGRDHTVILSSHILSEVQAVCDRVVIINEGRIVADEKTEHLTSMADDGNDFVAKICGPVREVTRALREMDGVLHADSSGERDGDAYVFRIRSASGIDIRKSMFRMLSENDWPLVGLESVKLDLEDVFVRLTAKNSKAASGRRA